MKGYAGSPAQRNTLATSEESPKEDYWNFFRFMYINYRV